MSVWTCPECRSGQHHHDRYPDGSDAGCPASPDTTTPCACREVVHEGTDWRARALAVVTAERDRLAAEVETLRARLAAVEALADKWEREGRSVSRKHAPDWTLARFSHSRALRAALEVTPDA